MSNELAKADEIKRLTSPLTFRNSKAYDCDGNLIKCVETMSEVKFIIEPKKGVLSDDEVLQYAPESREASRIRLERGNGNVSDVLLVHESLPWLMGIYYVIIITLGISVLFKRNIFFMFIVLILAILPLIYSYYIFNLKSYTPKPKKVKAAPKPEISKPAEDVKTEVKVEAIPSLKKHESEINNLKVLFDVKESVAKDLIEKRFTPPQITYDKFISMVDSAHKLFYHQVDAAENIINLAADDTERIHDEINNKINIMKSIIDQIEDLTNELVININSDSRSDEEVKGLLEDMENLIDSVKDY